MKGVEMMSYSFNVKKPKELKNTFMKFIKLLEEKGCSLEGDETQGRIIWSDGVEGIYDVKTDSIKITLQKNPFKLNKPVEIYIRWVFRNISCKINS